MVEKEGVWLLPHLCLCLRSDLFSFKRFIVSASFMSQCLSSVFRV